jgi:RHS repeat-associated protein
MTMSGVIYALAYDQLGSLRIVADGAGNVVKRIDYDTFGNIITDTNSSLTVPFGFAGGLHDRDIALVKFGYRDYDPETGRWTAKDPIGFAGGDTDLYGYVADNPVNLIDPDGLFAGPVAVGVGVGLGVGLIWFEVAYPGEIDRFVKDLLSPDSANDPCAGRKKWKPNKPNRKKQGREPREKKRKHKKWKPRNAPKEPPRHTPSRKN